MRSAAQLKVDTMPEYRYRIMIVDDDEDIVDLIQSYMTPEGYKVIPAYDGASALQIFNQAHQTENSEDRIHLILLDLMMPKIDGFDVCREIRKISNVPILMLTGKTEDIDKIIGLELGADDYMEKPFNPRELLARIRSVIRRSYAPNEEHPGSGDGVLVSGDIRIDPARRTASMRDRDLKLTATEFDLLYFLVKRAGKVFTRRQLIDHIWNSDYCIGERTVDVHIRRLREHVEEVPSRPQHILTVWGVGYKFHDGGVSLNKRIAMDEARDALPEGVSVQADDADEAAIPEVEVLAISGGESE